MRRMDAVSVAGVVLIVLGLLFFLQNVARIWFPVGQLVWGILFGGAGVAFAAAFVRDRSRWWTLLLGFPLLGVGLLLLMESFSPRLAAATGGAVFLGMVSLAFWLVYLVRREFWWAIIPGGVVATLALMAVVSEVLPEADVGGLLFLGVGSTFVALYLLPEGRGRQPWAIVPGAILILLAAVTAMTFGAFGRYLWPILFILGGIYLIVRYGRSPARG